MDSSQPPTDSHPQEDPDDEKKNVDNGQAEAKKPSAEAQGRKRTKTGCLTCRRRRIKCGEERPTCRNCKKSKRQCEGYIQRVVFKDPLNSYRPSFSGSSHTLYTGLKSSSSVHRQGDSSQKSQATITPIPIAPKSSHAPTSAWPISPEFSRPAASSETEQKVLHLSGSISDLQSPTSRLPKGRNQRYDGDIDRVDRSQVPEPSNGDISQIQATKYALSNPCTFDMGERIVDRPGHIGATQSRWLGDLYNLPQQTSQDTFHTTKHLREMMGEMAGAFMPGSHANSSQSQSSTFSCPGAVLYPGPSHIAQPRRDSVDINIQTSKGAQIDHSLLHDEKLDVKSTEIPRMILNLKASFDRTQAVPPQTEDDELYDVSDDNVSMEEYNAYGTWAENARESSLGNNNLGAVVAFQAQQDTHNLTLRSFTSFIDGPDMLATYVPSAQSSPLSNRMTAKIFYHFVNVTGPSISMFERHPANPSLIFQGQPVPNSQQHIWTYTFPTLALQDPALLHSMLAVASLHIAKLQNGPVTASLKHYAFGLRRVAKSVSLPHRRRQPATLAAAMLLAFYECWSADHQKWSNHLLGARQLVREIDFLGMTKRIKAIKMQQKREHNIYEHGGSYSASEDVDEAIISMLMGRRLRYDEYGRIMVETDYKLNEGDTFSNRDLEIYETLRDLFWWYCKQDVYQSILGGGRLFMEYSLWSHCPPRSPVGRLNATYGTYDHLILLMGRLANFAAGDLRRKRLAMHKHGGWRPPPGTPMGPPNNVQNPERPSRATEQTSPRTQMPAFSGMLPVTGEVQLPMGFLPMKDESPRSANVKDEVDLEIQTVEAEEEWHEIRHAFNLLESHFGEEFQPLGPEFSAPVQTPFGPAQQYRTYGIAGIWMNYYMGLIACHRSHPLMPPAAMVAAGVAAGQTAFFANELGRIAAGIAPDCSLAAHVSPGVGAALIESATCLFVAGVQYQDSAQRTWTVQRLHDIARLTGWQTAYAIAAGCEKTWVKTAELGRGPPYVRIEVNENIPDLWSPSRRIDRAFYGLNNEERRMIIQRPDRVQYALALLGVQEDFENLNLDDENEKRGK